MSIDAPTQAELYTLAQNVVGAWSAGGWVDRDGDELYQAAAAMLADVGAYIEKLYQSAFIRQASGAVQSSGSVRLTLTAGQTAAFGLEAGSPLLRTAWGVTYEVAEAFDIAASTAPGSTVDVSLRAVCPGPEGDIAASFVATWLRDDLTDWTSGRTLTASGTTAGQTEFDAAVAAGNVTVAGLTDFTGGALATLDLIAQGMLAARADGETDADLRVRLRRPVEVVTPTRIARGVARVLDAYGVTATIEEWPDYGWWVGQSFVGQAYAHPVPGFVVLVPAPSGTVWRGLGAGTGFVGVDFVRLRNATHEAALAGVQGFIDNAAAAGVPAYALPEV